ncbi:hypothetical protein, partial [Burkholderia pseudomallei]|uniref:hypothetical protein n=1 Tax=Burkholderia pseudomallei TaxID=28450 RepID=UPI001CC314AD
RAVVGEGRGARNNEWRSGNRANERSRIQATKLAQRLNGSTAQRLKRPADSTNHPPPRGD